MLVKLMSSFYLIIIACNRLLRAYAGKGLNQLLLMKEIALLRLLLWEIQLKIQYLCLILYLRQVHQTFLYRHPCWILGTLVGWVSPLMLLHLWHLAVVFHPTYQMYQMQKKLHNETIYGQVEPCQDCMLPEVVIT